MTQAFTASVAKLVVSVGLVAGLAIGPLHAQNALARAGDLVAVAQRRGAKVMLTGVIEDRAVFAQGYYM